MGSTILVDNRVINPTPPKFQIGFLSFSVDNFKLFINYKRPIYLGWYLISFFSKKSLVFYDNIFFLVLLIIILFLFCNILINAL